MPTLREIIMNTVDVGIKYEKYCMALLQDKGYSDVTNTKASGDQGIDIIAYHDGVKFGFQCKYYSSPVGNHAVQEASSGAKFYECNAAIVITNSSFTDSAKKLAAKIGVVLWEGVEMPEEGTETSNITEEQSVNNPIEESEESSGDKTLYAPPKPSERFVFYVYKGSYDVHTNLFLKEKLNEDFDFVMNIPYLSKKVSMVYRKEYENGTVIKLNQCGLVYSGGVGDLYCNVVIGGNCLRYIYPDIYLPVRRNGEKEKTIIILRPNMKPIEAKLGTKDKITKLKRAGYEGIPGLNGSLFVEIID